MEIEEEKGKKRPNQELTSIKHRFRERVWWDGEAGS